MKAIRAVISGNETMHIHEGGFISRPSLRRDAPSYVGPSGQWRVVDAVERNNFGGVVRHYSLAEILERGDTIPWQHKNGKQRVFLRDLDHGTMREWRSPTHRISYKLASA